MPDHHKIFPSGFEYSRKAAVDLVCVNNVMQTHALFIVRVNNVTLILTTVFRACVSNVTPEHNFYRDFVSVT